MKTGHPPSPPIIDNHADRVGGGIANDDGTLTVERSLINNNTAGDDGPALDVDGGQATITDTTITGNTGPFIIDSDTETAPGTVLSFVTLSGNDDPDTTNTTDVHAAFWFRDPAGSAHNSIIAGNTSTLDGQECFRADPSNGFAEIAPAFADASHVLDDDGSCVGDTPTNGSATVADPRLGDLADNGGPTDTMALLTGSPAINAADSGAACPDTDQRGVGRPVDGVCDIGAFEGATAASSGGGASGGPAASPPAVTGVSPASGPAGTFVGITGRNLDSASQVLFGGIPTSFTIDGYGHITAVAPAGGTGAVDVQVVNPAGKSVTSPTDVFTYSATAGPTTSGDQGAPGGSAVKQVCVMPKLLRHSYRYSKKLLGRAGCVGPLTHKGHAKHPPSHVKRQSPAAGTALLQGETISLKLG